MAARLMLVEGVVQKSKEGVLHLMASRIIDATDALDRLSDTRLARPELSRADAVKHPEYRASGRPSAQGAHPAQVAGFSLREVEARPRIELGCKDLQSSA